MDNLIDVLPRIKETLVERGRRAVEGKQKAKEATGKKGEKK